MSRVSCWPVEAGDIVSLQVCTVVFILSVEGGQMHALDLKLTFSLHTRESVC